MKNAIEINGLQKTYGDFTLDIPSLTLPSGCILGLIGENGAGKSTTIRLLLNLIRQDAGEIMVLGETVGTAGFERIKEDVGVVFDEPGFPPALTGNEIGRVLRYAYKNWDDETYKKLSNQFGLPMDKKFSEYSKGMKMKLSIAAALSHHPRLLILDEATSGLDPVVRDEILDIFMDFTRDEDHSILISSHIVSDLEKLCDTVAFLHQGRLLLHEEKDRLAERYGVVHCSEDEIMDYGEAVCGRRITPYGAQILVDRTKLATANLELATANLELATDPVEVMPVGIEELFVYLVKEGNL